MENLSRLYSGDLNPFSEGIPREPEALQQAFNLTSRLKQEKLMKRMSGLMSRLSELEAEDLGGLSYIQERDKVIQSIFIDSGMNPSLLTPYFFPRYPKRNPMSMLDRPFNMLLMFFLPFWTFVLRGSRQIGKAQPYSEYVLAPEGWVRMGELKVGDSLFDRAGVRCSVTGIFEQGVRDVFEAIFKDGRSARCDLDHNWLARAPGSSEWSVWTLRQMIRWNNSGRKVEIPLAAYKEESYSHARRDGRFLSGQEDSVLFSHAEFKGKDRCRCIAVSSPDHTYLTRDFLVTHNTTTLGTRVRIASEIIENYSSLYITPHMEPLRTFARKFDEINRNFRYPVQDVNRFKQNMFYRKYPNESIVDMARVQTSSTSVRGKSSHEILLDECVVTGSLVTIYEEDKKKSCSGARGGVEINKLSRGDKILAFDSSCGWVPDTVIALKNKGFRPVWTVTTKGGKSLICTSNEKIRSTEGWTYLAHHLPEKEVAYCSKAKKIRGFRSSSAAVPTRNTTGRRFAGANKGGSQLSAVHHPRISATRLLSKEVQSAGATCQQAHADSGKQGLRVKKRHVQHPGRPGLNGPGSHRHPHWATLAEGASKEICHPAMGGGANLGSDSVVVHGRRLSPALKLSVQHTELFGEGGQPAPGLVPGSRCRGKNHSCKKGSGQDLPPSSNPGIGDADGDGEAPAFRGEEHALQVEAGHQKLDLPVLREQVSGLSIPQDRSGSGVGVLHETEVCGGEERGSSGKAQRAGQREGAHEADVRILRGDLPEHQESPSEGGRPDHLLHGTDLCGEEERGLRRDEEETTAGTESPLRVLTIDGWEEVVSVEYAGVREVWDIETEKHHTFFANGIGVHNCQLLDPNLEEEILEVHNDSDIKISLYTGTSTTFDTLLEARYQEGSQATWHVLLDNGNTIDCGNPEEVIPAIAPYGMVDPATGKKINPLRGFFKFNNPAGFHSKVVSAHIPQVINPDIVNNALQWRILHRAFERNPDKATQEKLGIPVSSASREITEDDLKRICQPDLVKSPEERIKRAKVGFYRMVVSGVDWGGSDYNQVRKTKISNTLHTILGVTKEGTIHVLKFRRHGGADYKTIMNLIALDHSKFSGGAIATDFGVGETYHEMMRSHSHIDNSRHVIFHYTGPRNPVCSTMKGRLANTLNLNRTESITSLLLAMVSPEPIILCPSWEESEEYLSDFMNIHRVLSEKSDEGGQKTFVYHRDASKPDDTVHSMNFAYSLIRLLYNNILIKDEAAKNLVRTAVLGSSGAADMGSIASPNSANKLLTEFNESWNQDYDDPEYYDWE